MTKVTLVENGTMSDGGLHAGWLRLPRCQTRSCFAGDEDATSLQVSVLALDGDTYPDMPNMGASDQENLMHGWSILQACFLDQGRPSIQVLRALNSDIAQGHTGVPVDCFQPRHAVRINPKMQ